MAAKAARAQRGPTAQMALRFRDNPAAAAAAAETAAGPSSTPVLVVAVEFTSTPIQATHSFAAARSPTTSQSAARVAPAACRAAAAMAALAAVDLIAARPAAGLADEEAMAATRALRPTPLDWEV